jgi:folate-binding protein YgfZ
MPGETDPTRVVLAITGPDRETFLQGLVTNDVRYLAQGPVYAAILTPQGKYLADFLLVPGPGDTVWLDVAAPLADDLLRRLTLYRLRAQVTVTRTDLAVTRGLGDPPPGAVADPRHPALGWRAYGEPGGAPGVDWDAIRVAHVIPETGVELIPNDTYILEAGFERLHGVDFRKGCYVGQEVTARMKHKTELRKGFVGVSLRGGAAAGTPVTADGREIGHLTTVSGNRAIAWLRLDRADGPMQAGDAAVTLRAD